jgi:hypothetical protein
VVHLKALGRCWGCLSDDGRYLEVRRADSRVARIDLVLSARYGRPVLVRSKVDVHDSIGRAYDAIREE